MYSGDNTNTTTSTLLPPAYQSLSQEMSQLLVNETTKVPLSDLWEKDEFAKAVHLAIEGISSELRAISLQVSSQFLWCMGLGMANSNVRNTNEPCIFI